MSLDLIEAVPTTFTRRKGELTKIHKQLDKITPAMVILLEGQANDVKLDPKIRQKAAELLLKYFIETSKTINADNMARMLADIKYGNGKLLGGSTAGDDSKNTADVDFANILEIE